MSDATRQSKEDIARARAANLSRRLFLKGLGVAVALPAMESLVPIRAFAAAASSAGADALATTASGAPLRSAFIYFPNGAIPGQWWPADDAADFVSSPTLQPLAESKQLVQLMAGLDHQNAYGGKDGAGDHARANGTFLTGVRMKKSATDIHAGTSIDQVIARQIGHTTRFPSLELSCDPSRRSGACDSGYACAYQYNVSWKDETTPMAAEFSPRRAFERLFGSGAHGERTANLKQRQAEQRSILDFVMEDARVLASKAGSRDRQKLDQYLTGIREIEQRIARTEKFGATPDPDAETPPGVPASYQEHVQLMFDMLLLAFQTDSTRVATLMLAHDGSNRSFAEIGVSEGHHDLSHHRERPELKTKVATIDQWYVKQFARFLKKLDESKDTDGKSLLYNSQIVYGSGNADGNRHTHSNLPIILAGAGGGTLKPGRVNKAGGVPASNLFVNMAQRVGLRDVTRFGDSTKVLEEV
jgi:hypothetical protein